MASSSSTFRKILFSIPVISGFIALSLIILILGFKVVMHTTAGEKLTKQITQQEQEMLTLKKELKELNPDKQEPQKYKNEKYGFQFDIKAPSKNIANVSHYSVEERGNQIVIVRTRFDAEDSTKMIDKDDEAIITVYDATPEDGKDLEKWWESTIEKDIGKFDVPDDYETSYGLSPGTISDVNMADKNSVLEVFPKRSTGFEIWGVSTYLFFGSYILQYDQVSSGGPDDPDSALRVALRTML